jgi:nucleoside-diphosphate-sugar epimerase
MKRALVFGGNGFLGSFVIKELCDKNFEVLIVSRTKGNFEVLKTFGFPGQISLKLFDITSSNSLEEFDFSKFDVVINLIGIGIEKGKNSYHLVHTEFPARLASVTKKSDVKFLHVSAFTGNEDIPSKYIKTKRDGEHAILKNNPKSIIIRPSTLIGNGSPLIQMFEKIIDISPIVPLVGGGKTKIQPIFAGDVAKFIIEAIETEEMRGKAFNLLGEETILLKEFVERICGFMDKKPLLIPAPLSLVKFGIKFTELLPKFIFKIAITSDILSLSKYNIVSQENHTNLIVKNPKTIDEVLAESLSKYRLYD